MKDALFYFAGAMCAQGARPYRAPTPLEARAGARAFPYSVWMHHGTYAKLRPGDAFGSNHVPYLIPPEMCRELGRAIDAAQSTRGHICHAYTSPGVALRGDSTRGVAPRTVDELLEEARKLREYGFKGVYADGLSWYYYGRRAGTTADNLRIVRGLGDAFEHVIAHLTHYDGQGRVNSPELDVETSVRNLQVLIGEWTPDASDPEACKEYVETQVRARLYAGVELMLTERAWNLCPDDLRSRVATYACSLMRPDGSGGTRFSDGRDFGPYVRIRSAR